MSSTEEIGGANNLSSVEKCSPKIIRHIGTLSWKFQFVAERMEIRQFVQSHIISIPRIHGGAIFKVEKTSEEVVSVSCCVVSETEDDGYLLRIYFTVIGVDEDTKRAEMRFPDNGVTVEYNAASFSNSAVNENYIYSLRCVFRLVETAYVSVERRDLLDRTFRKFIRNVCKSRRMSEEMSYILGRRSLDFMFTGREADLDFFQKTVYIKRAFSYLKELHMFFEAREESGSELPNIPIGEILGYIFGENNTISVALCTRFFMLANFLGLIFLKILCTYYILENLYQDVVLDVLLAADAVEDAFLFKAASNFFMKNQTEIFQSDKFKKMKDEQNEYTRRIIHRIILQIKFPEFKSAPQLEDELSGEE